MTYDELRQLAKDKMGPYCKCCKVCDGRSCKNYIPGPGCVGTGNVATKNYMAWQEVEVVMDTISSVQDPDTSTVLFDHKFDLPVFVAPVGAIQTHYSDHMTTLTYTRATLDGASRAGSLAFVGDGLSPSILEEESLMIDECKGVGIPTVKPWDMKTIEKKIEMVKQSNPIAIAMDIDAAGLPFLKNQVPAAGPKSISELKEIVEMCEGTPFFLKGVMSESGACKAVEAGVNSIIVSNHGGRVLDGVSATAEVLPQIVNAVGKDIHVLVDGGIRSGLDVFRALQLGASGCLIARPIVVAAFANGSCGVEDYINQIKDELKQTMLMCAKQNLNEF